MNDPSIRGAMKDDFRSSVVFFFSGLNDICKKEIGSFAKPDYVQLVTGLPKTRSGKIMRRILRKIAANELDSLGDISTLADPSVIDDLINDRLNK